MFLHHYDYGVCSGFTALPEEWSDALSQFHATWPLKPARDSSEYWQADDLYIDFIERYIHHNWGKEVQLNGPVLIVSSELAREIKQFILALFQTARCDYLHGSLSIPYRKEIPS